MATPLPPPRPGHTFNVDLKGENPWPPIAILIISSIVIAICLWQGWL